MHAFRHALHSNQTQSLVAVELVWCDLSALVRRASTSIASRTRRDPSQGCPAALAAQLVGSTDSLQAGAVSLSMCSSSLQRHQTRQAVAFRTWRHSSSVWR